MSSLSQRPQESMHYNTKLGLVLFLVYLVLYCGFVLLSSFSPKSMELTPITGVNLAIIYGFGLIVAAFVLAVVYGVMCIPETDPEDKAGAPAGKPSSTGQNGNSEIAINQTEGTNS